MPEYAPIYTYQHTSLGPKRYLRFLGVLVILALTSLALLTFGNFSSRKFVDLANMTELPTLNQFLADAKAHAVEHLRTGAQDKLTVIMGNEAGDLDSAACAISLSYLLTVFGPPTGHDLPTSTYVPLIQSEHADATLRPENTAAFRAAGIDPANLLFLDDLRQGLGLALDSSAFDPASNIALGLVDHPSLTGPWGGAKAANRNVEIVVDHHEDVGDHADAKLRIVKSPSKEPVGSASSLVANLYSQHLNTAAPSTGLRQVADLLISAIVIDTDNLRPAPSGKATQADFDAVKLLFSHSSFGNPATSDEIRATAQSYSPVDFSAQASVASIRPVSPTEDTDSATMSAKIILAPYWQVLAQSKMAVSHLSGRDLLRRDYKEVDVSDGATLKLGFSSVPVSVQDWLHKDRQTLSAAADAKAEVEAAWTAWWKTLDEFMEEKKLDIAVMTGTFRVADGQVDAGKHRRELVLAFAPRSLPESKAAQLWDELRRGLESDAHTSETDRRLMLEQPWKGQRLPDGKRERVQGLNTDGRRLDSTPARWAKVYKQANARANRKIVLPAVLTILQASIAKLNA